MNLSESWVELNGGPPGGDLEPNVKIPNKKLSIFQMNRKSKQLRRNKKRRLNFNAFGLSSIQIGQNNLKGKTKKNQ